MARYALTYIWSYNGGISGECLGVYPTKEKAQEAMKKSRCGCQIVVDRISQPYSRKRVQSGRKKPCIINYKSCRYGLGEVSYQ